MKNALSQSQLLWLCLAQGCVLLPVFFALPLGFSVYWLIVTVWRIQIHRSALKFPGKFVKLFAAFIGVLALLFSFTHLLTIETFVAFFLVSYSLKLVELYEKKDGSLILSLSFIAIAAGFLFHQSLWVSLYAVLCFFIIFQAWMNLYRLRRRSFFADLRSAFVMVMLVFPIMVVLFLVMPRVGQLWHMPSQSKIGNTGFSTSMAPGTFSKLIQSDRVAFRVTFEDESIPPPDQRYWRGLVLDRFDGEKWERQNTWRELAQFSRSTRSLPPEWEVETAPEAQKIAYSVLMEPHLQSALFTLMVPSSANSSGLNLRFGSDATLKTRAPVASRAQYSVTSISDYQYSPRKLSGFDFRANTQLPPEGNEKSREFSKSLRDKYGEGSEANRKIGNEVLRYFNESFVYTLQPPLMKTEAIDQFLFDAKQGFCEHYAGSFVYLMRAAGIPARVVVGYQGGEYNSEQGYLLVRQRDAHAWAEIWLEGVGWQRVDPTAAVAPERIERGLSEALNPDEVSLVGGRQSNVRWINWMQNQLEILNYRWQKAVVNYDEQSQSNFFQRFLGGREVWRIGLFMLISVGAALSIFFVFAYWPKKKSYVYPEARIYERHLRQLAKAGFVKGKGETAVSFALRVGKDNPAWQSKLLHIAKLYDRIAFAEDRSVLAGFKQACDSWHT